MKNNLKNNKLIIITSLISALIITITNELNLPIHTRRITIPFTVMLISYLIILKDLKKNNKAYFILIPLLLILTISSIIKIDYSNQILNIFIIPLLISIFFLYLVNKNYSISSKILIWFSKLFPRKLFSNLKYIRPNLKNKKFKIGDIALGLLFGGIVSIVIIFLLMSADDYFKAFIENLTDFSSFNIEPILIFIISFIILFSTVINIILNKDATLEKKKEEEYLFEQEDKIPTHVLNKTVVTTILSVINIVFILFLISEISRISNNFLQVPVGYIYSSYAREGFFQLLIVSFINFSIIMYLTYSTSLTKTSRTIKVLISLLTIFSCFLIFNSYYRMYMYINHYGFTVLRLQVVIFLTMELIMFILLFIKNITNINYKDALTYFGIIITFYIINLICATNFFINIIS